MNNNTNGKYTDLEVSKIEQFVADVDMFNAVRKALLEDIYYNGTPDAGLSESKVIMNGAYSLVAHAGNYPIEDNVLGQQLRAQWFGVNALKNAIDRIKNIKTNGVLSPIDVNDAI